LSRAQGRRSTSLQNSLRGSARSSQFAGGPLGRRLEIERDCGSFLEIAYHADEYRLTIAAEGRDAILAALESALR